MAYRATHVYPTHRRSLGEFDVSATASSAAEKEVKAQIKSGDLDAAGAADATAEAVAKAAGAAGGAAACAATGVGAAAAPICGAAGAWIAGEIYGPVKKFFSNLFGGESAAAKFRRKLTAAQGRAMDAWGNKEDIYFEANRTLQGIVRALYEERAELKLPPYQGWNDVMSALRREGLPVAVVMGWADLSPTSGEWRKTESGDPLTGQHMTEFLSWWLPGGSNSSHIEFQARQLARATEEELVRKLGSMFRELGANQGRLAQQKFLVDHYNQMAAELSEWIGKARDAAAIVAAKNSGEAATKLEAQAAATIRRTPPALKVVAPAPRATGPSATAAAADAALKTRLSYQAAQASAAFQAAQTSAATQQTVLVVAGVAAGALLIWKMAAKR